MSEEKVREILDRVHNTAKEIAEAYGVSPATVAKVRSEHNKRIKIQKELPMDSSGISVGG